MLSRVSAVLSALEPWQCTVTLIRGVQVSLPYEGIAAAAEQGFPGPGSYAAAVLRAHEGAGLATHIQDSTGAVRWAA